MNLELSATFEERLLDRATDLIAEVVDGEVTTRVRKLVTEAIEGRVASIVDGAIRAQVDAILAEGWQPMGPYGEPAGPRVTLRDIIGKAVTGTIDKTDPYSRKTPLTNLVDEAIEKELRGDVGKELARAKAAVREQVDAVIQAKLRETISLALGLGGGR